jgi:hypothetical protein
MPKKSKDRLRDEVMLEDAEKTALDTSKPDYVRNAARSSYNALRTRMEKEAEERRKRREDNAKVKRAKEIREMGFVPCAHLPLNGREPPVGYVGPKTYFDLAEFLDAQAINRS